MSYQSGYLVGGGVASGFGDVPAQAGSTPVRTRFPSGPNAGQLADRYATYADVPWLLRPFAEQLGAAGYWYAPPANPLDTLTDQGTQLVEQVPVALETAHEAATGLLEGSAKWLILAGGAYLALPYIFGRKR